MGLSVKRCFQSILFKLMSTFAIYGDSACYFNSPEWSVKNLSKDFLPLDGIAGKGSSLVFRDFVFLCRFSSTLSC